MSARFYYTSGGERQLVQLLPDDYERLLRDIRDGERIRSQLRSVVEVLSGSPVPEVSDETMFPELKNGVVSDANVPLIENLPEVVVVPEPEPVVAAEPVPEPVVVPEPEPAVAPEPEPVVAAEPVPEPAVVPEPEPAVAPEPEPASAIESKVEPVVAAEPEPGAPEKTVPAAAEEKRSSATESAPKLVDSSWLMRAVSKSSAVVAEKAAKRDASIAIPPVLSKFISEQDPDNNCLPLIETFAKKVSVDSGKRITLSLHKPYICFWDFDEWTTFAFGEILDGQFYLSLEKKFLPEDFQGEMWTPPSGLCKNPLVRFRVSSVTGGVLSKVYVALAGHLDAEKQK